MPLVGTKPAVTIDNFAAMIREDCMLVDKTLMIKELMDSTDSALLIIRPRRFGKSLNLSMLQYFFAAIAYGRSTQCMFDRFEIAKVDNGEFLKQHQGQYPVILISFKDVKQNTCQGALENFNCLIAEAYRQHSDLLDSDTLGANYKSRIERYLDGQVTTTELEQSLRFLSECLYRVHGKEVIILIDEYDTPLTSAYEHGYIEEFNGFLRGLLSNALKSNPYLKKAVLTGILRVSKNSMLSGLNNLRTYTLFDHNYQQYFGFTEAEIDELTTAVKVEHGREDIRSYYNGYKIGDTVIYNPWSIMNYLQTAELAPYWVWTSNDKLFKELLLNSSEKTKEQLGLLMQNQAIEADIELSMRYEDLIGNPNSLWALLLFCGYLKLESHHLSEMGTSRVCQLKIPNTEIMRLFNGIFANWLRDTMGWRYEGFLKHLTEGKVEAFTEDLSAFLMNSLSFRDVGGDKAPTERFYHGFFIGLTASLQEKYHYTSNRESGAGVYDVGLVPRSFSNDTGVILEFKHAKLKENLTKLANDALLQIDKMGYETEFRKHPHVKKLLKIGLAFSEKAVKSVYTITDLSKYLGVLKGKIKIANDFDKPLPSGTLDDFEE